MGSRAIGLDLATTCVRAAELSYTRDQIVLERFAQMPLPLGAVQNGEVKDPEAVATAIKMLWKRGKFKGRNVSIGVESQRVVVRSMEIPYVSPGDRRKSLPLVVGDQIPLPVDEAVMDFVSLATLQDGDSAPRSKGLLVAADDQTVLAAIEAVEGGGLRVTDVDLTPFAVVRAVVESDPMGMESRLEAVVDVGASTTSLIVHANGVPQFVRILMMGGQDITLRLMSELGVNLPTAESLKREATADDPDAPQGPDSPAGVIADVVGALVDELRGSVDYYLSTGARDTLSRILLTGGGSLIPGLASRLEVAIGLPVERGYSLLRLGSGRSGLTEDHLVFADPLAAAAVGLAVRST